MRLPVRLAIPTTVLALGVALFGVARAQSGGQGAPAQATPPSTPAAPAPQGPAGSTPAGGGASRDLSLGLQRPVGLSVEDMRKQGDQTVARIESAAAVVRKMLEQARTERDVVKTLCLNDKLSQLDVTLRSAKERRTALESAANRRDNELSAHEFTILGVYRQRSERISTEANQCIGNEAGFLGDTRVSVSVDPTLPPNEPPTSPNNPMPPEPYNPIVVPPPSCASCSL